MTGKQDVGFVPADPEQAWARFEHYRARQQDVSDNHGEIRSMADITRRLETKLADDERLAEEMRLFTKALDDA